MKRTRRDFSQLVGQYGYLVVLEKTTKPSTTKVPGTYYLCRCECGSLRVVKAVSLVDGHTRSCGCKAHCLVRRHDRCGMLTAAIWCRITHSAASRGIAMHLTQAEAWALFCAQDGRCALTGTQLTLGTASKGDASLDRIDSSGVYSGDNCQWVLKEINMMRRDLPITRFVELCQAVVTHYFPPGYQPDLAPLCLTDGDRYAV